VFSQLAPLALIGSEIPRIINFIIFAAVLYYFLRKPIAQFFRDRVLRISRELAQARADREEARAKLQQIESRLTRLDEEIQELNIRAAAEADAEDARIRVAAQADAEKLQGLARREIESATNVARLELKAFAAAQAAELARTIIRREITDGEHHRLIENFSQQISEVRQ
jgi:F-type H+-transporting ATPase subunit b